MIAELMTDSRVDNRDRCGLIGVAAVLEQLLPDEGVVIDPDTELGSLLGLERHALTSRLKALHLLGYVQYERGAGGKRPSVALVKRNNGRNSTIPPLYHSANTGKTGGDNGRNSTITGTGKWRNGRNSTNSKGLSHKEEYLPAGEEVNTHELNTPDGVSVEQSVRTDVLTKSPQSPQGVSEGPLDFPMPRLDGDMQEHMAGIRYVIDQIENVVELEKLRGNNPSSAEKLLRSLKHARRDAWQSWYLHRSILYIASGERIWHIRNSIHELCDQWKSGEAQKKYPRKSFGDLAMSYVCFDPDGRRVVRKQEYEKRRLEKKRADHEGEICAAPPPPPVRERKS